MTPPLRQKTHEMLSALAAAAAMVGGCAADELPVPTRQARARLAGSSIRVDAPAWTGLRELRRPAIGECDRRPPIDVQDLRTTDLWARLDGDGPDRIDVSGDCAEITGIDCQEPMIFLDVFFDSAFEVGFDGGRGTEPASAIFDMHPSSLDARLVPRQQPSDPIVFEWEPNGAALGAIEVNAVKLTEQDGVYGEEWHGLICGVDPDAGTWQLPVAEQERMADVAFREAYSYVTLFDEQRFDTDRVRTYLTVTSLDSVRVFWDPGDDPFSAQGGPL